MAVAGGRMSKQVLSLHQAMVSDGICDYICRAKKQKQTTTKTAL